MHHDDLMGSRGAPGWPARFGHVNQNRLLLVDARGRATATRVWGELGRRICAADLADDLLVIDDTVLSGARMRVFGGDGREADFCGNGALLAAEMLSDGPEVDGRGAAVELWGRFGRCRARRLVGSEKGPSWMVEVGEASFMQVAGEPRAWGAEFLGVVSLGEPHAIFGAPEALSSPLNTRAAFEEFAGPLCEAFGVDGGVNVTMIEEQREGILWIRTYERGRRAQTCSCGTGAAAAAAAALGPAATPHWVNAPGGAHLVSVKRGCWFIGARPRLGAHARVHRAELHVPITWQAGPRDRSAALAGGRGPQYSAAARAGR